MKSKIQFLVIYVIISFSLISLNSIGTNAYVPDEVSVVIRIKNFSPFEIDGDTFGPGDIFFRITYDGTEYESGVAWNDYEDDHGSTADLYNTDFDGSGYYDESFMDLNLNYDELDWVIEAYDTVIGAKLLFKGTFTVKTPTDSGTRSYTDVNIYRYKVSDGHGGWILLGSDYNNEDCSFVWNDGPFVYYNSIYYANGLTLWVSLHFY